MVDTSFATASASIQTVLGPIPASSLGFTLPHEHVMVDFIGAEKTNRARWNVNQVVARMKPFLMAARQSGVLGFVDCTPVYLGRDPRVLKKLAQDTGLHILTNTGYYGDGKGLYLPASAQSESSQRSRSGGCRSGSMVSTAQAFVRALSRFVWTARQPSHRA